MHQIIQVQKNEVDCTYFHKCKGLCKTSTDILKNNFCRKWAASIKKKKIVVVFPDFFLLYAWYDFTLVLFSYKNYFIQKEFFILYSNFLHSLFSLRHWNNFLNVISSFLVCSTRDADFLLWLPLLKFLCTYLIWKLL